MPLKQNYQACELCSAPPKWSTQVSNLRPQSLHSSLKQRQQTTWQPQRERWKAAGSGGGGGDGEVERDERTRHWYRESHSDEGDKKQHNCQLDAWKVVARWLSVWTSNFLFKTPLKNTWKKTYHSTALKSSSWFKRSFFSDVTSSPSSSPALCIPVPCSDCETGRRRPQTPGWRLSMTTWVRDAERRLAKPRQTLSRWVKRDHLWAGDNTEER